ncbi:MAG: hypothetical protein JWO12_1294 [Frankiales bacterium]|nr:hypothetical protein [Frankiales bacterium]
MVGALAFVPSPPFLLNALGGGPASLRSLCLQAISVLEGRDLVVLGAGDEPGWVKGTVDATAWGARGERAPDPLPLALAVGSTLLGDRQHRLLAAGGLELLGDDVGLLVVGDGSARRTEKAPGHLDPRAAGYDASVAAALAAGDPSLLGSLDQVLGKDLLVGGLAAWCSAAVHAGEKRWDARVLLDDAPYGVGYFVATWT